MASQACMDFVVELKGVCRVGRQVSRTTALSLPHVNTITVGFFYLSEPQCFFPENSDVPKILVDEREAIVGACLAYRKGSINDNHWTSIH